MKPRLDSLPMTHEDTAIWCQVFLKAGGWPEWSHGRFQRADRRDADLMLGFRRLPQLVPELQGFRPLARLAFHVEFDAKPIVPWYRRWLA